MNKRKTGRERERQTERKGDREGECVGGGIWLSLREQLQSVCLWLQMCACVYIYINT